MTTICYRDEIMAVDSRAYSGDKHPIGTKVKISRLEDGTLLGCSSTIPGAGEFVCRWYAEGMPEETALPEFFTLLVVKPNGEAFVANNARYLTGPLEAPFFSIGSGEQYAYGALKMGATAVEAVRVACDADAWSDFPIIAMRHDKPESWRVGQ